MSKIDFNERIEKASDADECETVKADLKALLYKVEAKLEAFQEEENKAGLNFKGKNAKNCLCGNSVDPEGGYIDVCEDCGESFCVECMRECEGRCCSKLLCSPQKDDNCIVGCEICGEILCKDCSNTCDYCKSSKLCETCPKEIGPYGDMVCPDCFEYLNKR